VVFRPQDRLHIFFQEHPMRKPILAVTIGDPSGAGPEICVKALKGGRYDARAKLVMYGDERVIRKAQAIVGDATPLQLVKAPAEFVDGRLNVLDVRALAGDWQYARVQANCGKAAFEYIHKAVTDAIADVNDGVVTGPINKEALNLAGIHYEGMTEIFADLTKTKDYAMLLTGGPLKVIHVSTHCSMLDACKRVTRARVYRVIKLAHESMLSLGYEKPRIAVAGFNCHAGEGGLFGREEIDQIIPAIEQARAEGIDLYGPLPPDTVFLRMKNGQYDIVVAQYHDQGHIPLKIVDFMGGVNVTVGIPVIRTSVDHGTVFGKAGKGTADETSMHQAVELGIKFALSRIAKKNS
jgi:4-phospho-D-threonate 3-dehydrogenase / 4-phospho-D-erythronate 3-dehydrogenase